MAKKKKNATVTIKTVGVGEHCSFALPKPVELARSFVEDPLANRFLLAEVLRLECEALTGETIPVIVEQPEEKPN